MINRVLGRTSKIPELLLKAVELGVKATLEVESVRAIYM